MLVKIKANKLRQLVVKRRLLTTSFKGILGMLVFIVGFVVLLGTWMCQSGGGTSNFAFRRVCQHCNQHWQQEMYVSTWIVDFCV
jgi:hypothetical protein